MPPAKQLSFDVDGANALSVVLTTLLNEFPGIGTKEIKFSALSQETGIGFFPVNGAAIVSSAEDITGHVKQTCSYPFIVVYRSAPKSEAQKVKIKEFLDALGCWMEREPVTIGSTRHQLEGYPELSGGRIIKSISRTNQAYLSNTYQDGVEDWAISATLRYDNEYTK